MISNPMFYWKHSNKKLKVKVFSADRPYNSDTICCPALGDPVDCSTPGSSVLHYLPEFTQIHVQ